jgi:DNA-binding response OmpR family regulator
MRILVAEDNLAFRAVLQAMLTQWGHEVIVASNGEEAWRLLQDEDGPRLAILDWVMPGLDGIEVCRRVRIHNHFSYTYILILTAKTESEDLRTAMEVGADDYVTKPLKSGELRARLYVGCRILELQERLQFTKQLVVTPEFDATQVYRPVQPTRNPRRGVALITEIHRTPKAYS